MTLLLVPAIARAQPPCQLCAATAGRPGTTVPAPAAAMTVPLAIEIESGIDFSRAAVTNGGGSIAIDGATGARSVTGLRDLGGMAMRGVVRLTGQPGARVRVTLPNRIELRASDGTSAEVADLASDLGADPRLDATGTLVFNFGGRLVLPPGATGDLRGRIPIAAEYN